MNPLTVEVVEQLILKEQPDSILPTLGGQAGLNLAMELEDAGFLREHNVRLIGTTALTIKKAEDREMFKETMEKIGEPVAPSDIVEDVKTGLEIAAKIGYPVVLRPAYTLGGSGGGIAHNPEQCAEILENGLRLSRVGQVLVERCIAGWKEIEYEVMRDGAGNVITVCNMENIDPVGVHTGDSIVVAPSQTLGDKEYQMLRTSALNIISELGITGGCNVQYALNPDSFEYCVIEVNPRVSRSSALASKATGYPIAKVAPVPCLKAVRWLSQEVCVLLRFPYHDKWYLLQFQEYRREEAHFLSHVNIERFIDGDLQFGLVIPAQIHEDLIFNTTGGIGGKFDIFLLD